MAKELVKEAEKVAQSFELVLRELHSLRFVLEEEFDERGGFRELEERDVVFIGDLHGDFETLRKIVSGDRVNEVLQRGYIVFLGDYVDRGPKQVEVLLLVAKLKLTYPDRVYLIRGNHEPPSGLIPYPHDFPAVLEEAFGERGKEVYNLAMESFQYMPYAVKVGEVLALHGGLPTKAEEFPPKPNLDLLEEVLWNDPIEMNVDSIPSPRGAGYLFGRKVTIRWMKRLGFSKLIRGHEPCEGFMENHEGRVLTIFSRLGAPYYNSRAGIALLKDGKVGIVSF